MASQGQRPARASRGLPRLPGAREVECYNSQMFLFLRACPGALRGICANSVAAGWLATAIFLIVGCSRATGQTGSRDVNGLKQRAESSLASGQFVQAIESYQEWLRLQPADMAAEIGLARAYRGVHNYDEARHILELAHREHPGNADPLASLGDLDIEMQSYDEAIRHLTAGLSLRPADVETRNRLAVAYKAEGDIPKALAQVAKVLLRDPKNALAYYTRAQIYSDRNEDVLALRDAERVVDLQPKNALGSILLATILLRAPSGAAPNLAAEQCVRAVRLLEPLILSHANDSGTLYLLSRAYDCAGQSEQAQKILAQFEAASQNDRATKENQTQAKHMVEQANALALKNDLSAALDLLQQALGKDSSFGAAYSQLAKIYYSEDELEKASDAIGKALESDPYQPDFLYVQGKILEKQGKLDQALEAFEQTTLVNPKESDAFFEMGAIYQQRKDRTRALAAYKKAAEISPDDPDYQRALAGVQ
jgi:tetratricopeptide (TPR) repeat protein